MAQEHIDMWLSICNQKGIKDTEKSVARKVEAYCTSHGELVEQDSEATWQQYSKEAFVDAVLEWIVTDNQVSQNTSLG